MSAYAEPIVIVGDLHLRAFGSWRDTLERLAPVWAGARTVLFNGDTIDWSRKLTPEIVREMADRIETECRDGGARAVLLAGNADYAISDLRYLKLADKRLLVTHGHVILPCSSPWRPGARRYAAMGRAALEAMPRARRESLDGQFAAANTVLDFLYSRIHRKIARHPFLAYVPSFPWFLQKPHGLWIAAHMLAQYPQIANAFLDAYAPETRFLVMGHFHHRAGVRRVRSTRHCQHRQPRSPRTSLRVWIENGTFRVETIVREGNSYRPGVLLAEFPLDDE